VPKAGKQALVLWLIALALIFALLFLFSGVPRTAEGAREAFGRVFAQTGLAALACWLLARRKTPGWSWARFTGIYVLICIALGLLAATGRARAAEPWPFEVRFPEGWSTERLEGLSSSPQDRDLGVRSRATWKGSDGMALIEIACAAHHPGDHPDVDAELHKVAAAMVETLSEHLAETDLGETESLSLAHREWRTVVLRAHDKMDVKFVETIAVATSRNCLLVSTMAGTPVAFAQQQSKFATVLGSLDIQ
jgi:hypothetical protein